MRLAQLKDAGRQDQLRSRSRSGNVATAIEIARTARDILGGVGILDEHQCMRHMCNLESVKTYEGTEDMHLLIMGQARRGLRRLDRSPSGLRSTSDVRGTPKTRIGLNATKGANTRFAPTGLDLT